jgi:methionine-rich copper-binding protein CopC
MLHRLIPVGLALSIVAGVSTALAHSTVVRTSPPSNGSVQNAPREVSILFSERVQAAPDAIVVQDANGARVDQGDARLDSNRRVVRVSLKPIAAGTYKVNWRIQSPDGHTAQGSFSFRVRQ